MQSAVSVIENSAAGQCNEVESSGLHTMTRRQQPGPFTASRATRLKEPLLSADTQGLVKNNLAVRHMIGTCVI